MAITLRCQRCHRQISAPDSAGGKRGKCPYCGHGTYIPSPVSDEDVLDVAPIDEEAEREQQAAVAKLRARERDLIAETGGAEPVPLEHRDDLSAGDLHHFVVNYCLDMATGNLERAAGHAGELKKFEKLGIEAVKDFQSGGVSEPALTCIPAPVVQGFLKRLGEELG